MAGGGVGRAVTGLWILDGRRGDHDDRKRRQRATNLAGQHDGAYHRDGQQERRQLNGEDVIGEEGFPEAARVVLALGVVCVRPELAFAYCESCILELPHSWHLEGGMPGAVDGKEYSTRLPDWHAHGGWIGTVTSRTSHNRSPG